MFLAAVIEVILGRERGQSRWCLYCSRDFEAFDCLRLDSRPFCTLSAVDGDRGSFLSNTPPPCLPLWFLTEHVLMFLTVWIPRSDTPAPRFVRCTNTQKRQKLHSGRMYFFFLDGICQFLPLVYPLWCFHTFSIDSPSPLIPPSFHSSVWNRHSCGNGFLCKLSAYQNMPNTAAVIFFYYDFFYGTAIQWKTTVPPSSLQLTGTKLLYNIAFKMLT